MDDAVPAGKVEKCDQEFFNVYDPESEGYTVNVTQLWCSKKHL